MFDIHNTSAAAYSVAVDGDDFRYADSNDACLAMIGMSMRSHPGLTPRDVFPESVADEILRRYRLVVSTRQAINYLSKVAGANGPRVWRTTLFPVIDATGRVTTLVGICSEATDGTQDGTLSLNDKASLALGTIDGGYWIYEIADQAFETSRPLAQLIAGPGYSTLNLAEYLSYIHSEDLATAGLTDPESDRSTAEYRVVTHDGRTLWLKSRRRVIRDDTGAAVRVVGLVVDLTAQKLAFKTLETEAATDPLTSVGNRRAFDRMAGQSFREARAAGKPIGVVLVDLDDFKPINDRLGHRFGDEILRKVAQRIARHVRKSDAIARVGGDEFAILLRGSSPATGEPFAARLRQAFAAPFMLEGHAILVSVSTGVAVSAADDASMDQIVERADRNLYAMKQKRRLQTA